MLASFDRMPPRLLSFGAAGLLLLATTAAALAAACGGDDNTTVDSYNRLSQSPTPARSATPSATGTVDGTTTVFGPAPKLGGNVLKINPEHASRVAQATTRAATPDQPKGVCFEADFTGLDGNLQWFRLALDGEEVTPKLTWAVSSQTSPKGGRACYPLKDGLTVGMHTAAVSVQNPKNPAEPPRQLVAWGFEVIP